MTLPEPYYSAPGVTVYHAKHEAVLPHMPEASVDAVVTDPPYLLNFMGRSWDRVERAAAQEWHEAWAESALRVLKPGGHLVAFGGPRTYHRLASGIEDAGFEVRDSILDLLDADEPVRRFVESLSSEQLGAFLRCVEDSQFGGLLAWCFGSGFPKSLDVSKAIDRAAGVEREVVGEVSGGGRMSGDPDYRSGDYGRYWHGVKVTVPATPEAQRWDGWGTALKPAWESVILARKPLSGTVAGNVLEHGTGALNIDGCKVGLDGGGTHCGNRDADGRCRGHGNGGRSTSGATVHGAETASGRWPANVVLDEAAAERLDAQSGTLTSGRYEPHHADHGKEAGRYGSMSGRERATTTYGDSGGASRFYYTSKASKHDRPEIWRCDNCETDKLGSWESADREAITRAATVTSPRRDTTESPTKADSASPMTSCGNNITDQSPTDIKSTTGTTTSKITASRTSNSSPPPSTSGSTQDASDGTASGGNPAESVGTSNPSPRSTGTSHGKAGRSTDGAVRATSRRSSNPSVCGDCGSPKRRVAHPTVKPTDLMRWLVRLVTPPGGLVLDPFAGSGTTGVACLIEGFDCVLVEREAEYVPIIRERLSRPIEPVLDLSGGAA